MRGSLGEKIGEGAMADIHAWAPGRVLKLFKAGVPRSVGAHEARMTRAVFAAGGPAPEVFDEVTVDGRFGFVLPRLDGPTLLELLRARVVTLDQTGAILAALYVSVHKTTPPPAVLSLRDWFDAASRLPGGMLPKRFVTGILALIERLPPRDGVCHADLHPSNVIMTADGPRIIDWAATVRAPAAFDLGRCHAHLVELVYSPESVDPAPARALNTAVQAEYARLADMSPTALAETMESYLPIVRAFTLADGATNPTRRARLTQSVEATLRSEGLI